MKVLHAFPEILVEATFSLAGDPVSLELLDISSCISEEETTDVAIVFVVTLVVVGSKVYGFSELGAVVLPHFYDLLELEAIFVLQELELCVQLLNSVFIFCARISYQLIMPLIIKVEVEISAEKLSFVHDFESYHDSFDLVTQGDHNFFIRNLEMLMPLRNLTILVSSENRIVEVVVEENRAPMVTFDALFEVALAVDSSVDLSQYVWRFDDLLLRITRLHEVRPLMKFLLYSLIAIL